jgi:hypothetical protein
MSGLKYNPLSRRMFLQGLTAGGSYVAFGLPLLPSLLPSKAQATGGTIAPRFIAISSQNGGISSDDWYPAGDVSASSQFMFAASAHPTNPRYNAPSHTIHSGPIVSNAMTGISLAFGQKFHSFVPKMSFLKGLDYSYTPSGNHIGGPLLGNICSSSGNLSTFTNDFPTIDQIMAYANGFYPGGGDAYVRSLALDLGPTGRFSYGFQNPIARSGPVNPLPTMFDPAQVFTKLFGGTLPVSGGATTTPHVDAILTSFKRVRDGRAISSEDRQLLQSQIDLFADLETRLNTAAPPPISPACVSPTSPASHAQIDPGQSDASIKAAYQLMNDMIVLGLKCQRTRVASLYVSTIPGFEGLGGFSGLWHWASHNVLSGVPSDQAKATDIQRTIYKWINDNIVYDLISKMDGVVESNGKTMLDNSMVQVSTASVDGPHSHRNMPVVLFGNAGGVIKTGQYIDYQNRNIDTAVNPRTGLLFNQYLVTAMQAMGLTPTDYSMTNLGLLFGRYPTGAVGYGDYALQPGVIKTTAYYKGPLTTVGDRLPFIV